MSTSAQSAVRSYPSLPLAALPPAGRPLRVCIASPDFVGPVKNGGIGTAYTAMADALAAAGHEVTCLYGHGNKCASDDIEHWIAQYRTRSITLVPMPALGLELESTGPATKSYEAYHWLKQNDRFDVIHFPEWHALGYYSLLAKKQGLAFEGTTMCVGIHSMTAWLKLGAREHFELVPDVQLDYMEQQSVALADVVVSPSQYLLNWIADRGWKVPEAAYVQQYLMPRSVRGGSWGSSVQVRPVDELVFFGRLETRKGIRLFCDALDRLPSDAKKRLKQVTFLGKEATVDGVKSLEFLTKRAQSWGVRVQVISDRNQPEAVAYLRGKGRLAVIASQLENSPLTVYECLGAGIAFLACRVGGIPELVAPDDVETVCFDNRPAALADKMAKSLKSGMRLARPAQNAEDNERTWVAWHETRVRPAPSAAPALPPVWPKVSLCLTTYNRPTLLSQALESVRAITYPNLEVVLVDDGSTEPGAVSFLKGLEREFDERGWRIVRQENRYLGAARNTGARNATGDFFLFMDDDNYAEPTEVTTLVRAMLKSGADILSCGQYFFSGQEAPRREGETKKRWLPIGASAAAGIFCNCFGDANAMVRRSCFEQLGGFTEDYGVTHEDWEFHARAVLRGFSLQVVPEFLFWYRFSQNSMLRTLDPYPNRMRSLRPFVEALPPVLRDLADFAQGLYHRNLRQATELTPYAQMTLKWRVKLEAAQTLLALGGQEQAAVRLMIEAIKSVETCRVPIVIVEAILEVAPHLAPFDPGRARFLLGLAVKSTEAAGRTEENAKAVQLLAMIGKVAASAVPVRPVPAMAGS